MEVTFPYNEGRSVNYKFKEKGDLMSSGSAIPTGKGNTNKSEHFRTDNYYYSPCTGMVHTKKPSKHERSKEDQRTGALDN